MDSFHIKHLMIMSLVLCSFVIGQARDVQPLDAVEAVLDAFDDYQIVALSEMHAMQQEHEFIQTLIRDEAFPDKVDAVVMEGGNHLYQDVLDKYILYDGISLSEVRIVWRNSSQSPNVVWDAEVFEQIYTTIHDLNKNLPPDKRVRVIGGGVPIDWSQVETAGDLEKYWMSRDAYYADVVQNEILEKDKTALLIIGGMHLLKGSNSTCGPGTVTRRLEEFQPGSVFVVWPHTGLLGAVMDRQYLSKEELAKRGSDTVTTGSLERALASWPVPSVVLVKDTWLGDLKLSLFLPGGFSFGGEYLSSAGDSDRFILSDGIDAYLYVGPIRSLTVSPVSPSTAADKAYLDELNRRSLIRFGVPFDPESFITAPGRYFPESP